MSEEAFRREHAADQHFKLGTPVIVERIAVDHSEF
jgi:hypothetical protein